MAEVWCYIKGECDIFSVSIPPNGTIDELKNKIYKKGSSASFVGCDPVDLTLTKVDVNFSEVWNGINAGQYRPIPKDRVLRATELISEVWPGSPPHGYLHVFVDVVQPQILSASVLGKRRRAADDVELTDLPWLKEVHSKLWNRKDLRPQLFQKVEVTQAHYAALQRRLKELHSDRDSPDYNGAKPDVRSVKLDFLRSLTAAEALSPRHLDNDDRVDDVYDSEASSDDDDPQASNEDDPEIKLLFPSILSFLDLSSLELKEMVPNRLPLPLLLRQGYEDISKLIEKKDQSSAGSVIVSGQPGTGKTAYLYLKIIENMIEGRAFLYQAIGGSVYHVSEKGVEAVRSWSSKETIVAFIDGDKGDYEPEDILIRNPSVQLIVASSPKGAYKKWINQIGQGSFVTKLAVKLWSYEELLLTGIFLHHYDLTFKLLRESTSYFGYNSRQCFEASASVAKLEAKRSDVESVIIGAAVHGSDNLMQLLFKTRTGGSDVSPTIFQISPRDTDAQQLLSNCQFESVSRWALDLLLRQYETHKVNVTANFYHTMSGAGPLRGHVFE